MNHIHGYHIALSITGIIATVVFILSRRWLGRALSERAADGTYQPSSLRLGGFILILGVFFWESYTTFKKESLDSTHLLYILCTILLCWGVIRAADIIKAYRGGDDK